MNEAEKTLDIGCGAAKTPGAIGLDRHPGSDADVIADIDAPRLPFADAVFDRVMMIDTLEHVADVRTALAEAARTLKPGGSLDARVPHFSSLHAYSDVTHRHFFSAEGVRRLCGVESGYRGYAVAGVSLAHIRIRMWRAWRMLGLELIANAFPGVYEKLFAFSFTAMCIEFRIIRTRESNGIQEKHE